MRFHWGIKWLGVGVALVAGVFWWRTSQAFLTVDQAHVEGEIIPVIAQVDGRVSALLSDENDVVEHGQLLVQLDKVDLAQGLQLAEADLDAAKVQAGVGADMGETQARVQYAASNIEVLKSAYEQAMVLARQAKDSLARSKALVADGMTSRQQLENAESAARVAQLQAESASNALAAGRYQLKASQAAQRLAVSHLRQAEASRAIAHARLVKTDVYSPVGGRVAKRSVTIGQVVKTGQVLMMIAERARLRVVASVKETDIAGVRVGATVKIHIDALPDVELDGRVESIGVATTDLFSIFPAEDGANTARAVKRIPVKVVPDMKATALFVPGMNASVVFPLR
jgi:membrane fusion protein (multidrug efflux system)